jgi:predicted nucleic acid-binding protein
VNADRLFLDTAYALALLNRRDRYHNAARGLFERVRRAREVWTTEAVLIEVGNSLARLNRAEAVIFIRSCYEAPNMRVVAVDTSRLRRAVQRYEERSDKSWGLTDCLSFEVMEDHALTEALTADVHFEQAGYRILLGSPEAG